MNEYILKNYIDDKGKEPVKIWLKTLDATVRKWILLRLERLKDGNLSDYKQLNKYLYELRFDLVYYTIENETIVLLINGGDKKITIKRY